MVSIFRSGLLNDNVGPIAKSTFEVHTEVLLNASRHAEFDHMRGVSANIMCGQHGCYGTGAFNLVLDMKALENSDALKVEDGASMDAMFLDVEDDACQRPNMELNNNIINIKGFVWMITMLAFREPTVPLRPLPYSFNLLMKICMFFH
jgi:DNA-directed RNA polymerase II subunit RPB1